MKKILDKFNGLHFSQEYLCLDKESFTDGLSVYLVDGSRVIKDITNLHLFVGYCPLIFAFSSARTGIDPQQELIQLVFFDRQLLPNEQWKEKDAIAILEMKKIEQQSTEHDEILYYVGENGRHRFQAGFHQKILDLSNRLFNKKPGNVFLPGNLYQQVQIAYSIPRVISLITVGAGKLFNHFPTDLHGQVNADHYIISLRHAGRACQQVEAASEILLSSIHPSAYKKVYALGKNHMQPLKDISFFDFLSTRSGQLDLPPAANATAYKELRLTDSFIYGIHRVMIFQILQERHISEKKSTLSHIHNCYATWRVKQGKLSNYLLR